MRAHASTGAAAVALALPGGSSGCQPDRAAPSPEPPARCAAVVRTKLGVPFLAACGDDATDPPWLAAAPIECGMGDHATVACPTVLPLVARPYLPALMLPRTAVLTDAVTAHRVCRLRAPVAPDGSEPATLVPIACERAPIELHPSDADALAAFRCMLPSAALPPPIAPPLSP